MGHELHEIEPVFDRHSRILILGSFPSVKSREAGIFLSSSAESVLEDAGGSDGAGDPGSIPEKKEFL